MLLATKTVVSELCKVSFLQAFFFFNQIQKVTEINFNQSFSCSVSACCSKKAIQTPLKKHEDWPAGPQPGAILH